MTSIIYRGHFYLKTLEHGAAPSIRIYVYR